MEDNNFWGQIGALFGSAGIGAIITALFSRRKRKVESDAILVDKDLQIEAVTHDRLLEALEEIEHLKNPENGE